MKKYFLICCIIFTATTLITSCNKDEVVTPSSSFASYFDSKAGTTWIYDNYHITQDNDEIFIQQMAIQDTLTQGSNKVILEKDAILMRHRFINPVISSSIVANYAIFEDKEAEKLYVNDEFLKIFIPEELQTYWDIVFDSDKWFLFADAKTTKEWVVENLPLTDAQLPGPSGITITLNGFLKLSGKREKDTTITSINSHTYCLSIFFEGNATFSNIYTFPARIEFKKINFYLGEKKGLLGIYSIPNNISLTTDDPLGKWAMSQLGYPDGKFLLPIVLDGFDKKLESIVEK